MREKRGRNIERWGGRAEEVRRKREIYRFMTGHTRDQTAKKHQTRASTDQTGTPPPRSRAEYETDFLTASGQQTPQEIRYRPNIATHEACDTRQNKEQHATKRSRMQHSRKGERLHH